MNHLPPPPGQTSFAGRFAVAVGAGLFTALVGIWAAQSLGAERLGHGPYSVIVSGILLGALIIMVKVPGGIVAAEAAEYEAWSLRIRHLGEARNPMTTGARLRELAALYPRWSDLQVAVSANPNW